MKEVGFRCPHCGEVHGEYMQYGKLRSPMCLKCKKLVPKGIVPGEYIQHRPAKKRDKAIAVKREEGREVKRKEKKKTPLFITPKSPHEILEEVLREFGCDEVFIKAMTKRSKRIGGIYPVDLRNYLSLMKSGVGSRDQAAYVADEYAFALNEERDKARNIDYKTAYPLEERRYEKYEPPHKVRKKAYYTEYPEERYVRPYREAYRARGERDERVSRRDVREMVEEIGDIINKLIKLMSMVIKR